MIRAKLVTEGKGFLLQVRFKTLDDIASILRALSTIHDGPEFVVDLTGPARTRLERKTKRCADAA